jgi:hypothetical protein
MTCASVAIDYFGVHSYYTAADATQFRGEHIPPTAGILVQLAANVPVVR